MWETLIGHFELAIYLVGSAAGGSLGLGVFVVAVVSRLAALPLTYRLAKKARARKLVLDEIRDDLAALKEKWGKDPARLAEKTKAMYEARGLSLIDGASIRLSLLQAPVMLALFQAVRRVGGGALTSGTLPVALLAGSLSTTAVLVGGQTSSSAQTLLFAVLAATSAIAFTFIMGSGIGLYSAAFQGVSTVQGLLIHRSERKALRAAA